MAPTPSRPRPVILAAALALSPGCAVAASGHEAPAEGMYFDDLPVVLSATRLQAPVAETPAAVTIIDRAMIEASGARDTADLFRLVPGFVVGYQRGHNPVVTYHGLADDFPRWIQVLIDGRASFVPFFGGVPWSDLPLSIHDIERIEVVRGPNAVGYGANAFLAAINITTRHAAEDRGFGFSATAGSDDIGDAYVRGGGSIADLDFRVSAGYQSDDGLVDLNDSREIRRASARLDYLIDSRNTLSLLAGAADSVKGLGRLTQPFDPIRDEEASSHYGQLRWESVLEHGALSVQYYHSVHDVNDSFTTPPLNDESPLLPPPPPVALARLSQDRRSERQDLELQHTIDPGGSLRFVWGASTRIDTVTSRGAFGTGEPQDNRLHRLFADGEWRSRDDAWILTLGAMLEDSDLTERELSPRAAVIRRLDEHDHLRLVVSRATRLPTLFEDRADATVDIELGGVPVFSFQQFLAIQPPRPSEIISYEIGLHSAQRIPGLSQDLKLFHDTLNDILIFEGSDPEVFSNDGSVDVTGVELAVSYEPSSRLRVSGGLTLQSASSPQPDLEDSFPEQIANLLISRRITSVDTVSGLLYFVDEMSWVENGDVVPDLKRLDLRYARLLPAPGGDLRLEVVGQNLFGQYIDFDQSNTVEPRLYLRLSGTF